MFIICFTAIENDDDRDWLEQIFLSHYALIRRIVGRYVHGEENINDVIQECAIRMIKYLPKLRSLESCELPGYIVSICKSTSIDWIRKTSKSITFSDLYEGFEEQIPGNENVEDTVLDAISVEKLSDLMMQMSEKDAYILRAKYLLESDNEEIAKHLGISVQSVRTYISRARNNLKMIIQEKIAREA